MKFFARIRLTNGGRQVIAFRCPGERAQFIRDILKRDPGARVRTVNRPEVKEVCPDDLPWVRAVLADLEWRK